jgi:hypothetical protein
VAIAIVAETCGPFTVLPALMNEYRLPELNVQNGVLKALSFLFEYIGEMGKDYVYAVTPLLEDALMDRDLVHRQTSGTSPLCTATVHGCRSAVHGKLHGKQPGAWRILTSNESRSDGCQAPHAGSIRPRV